MPPKIKRRAVHRHAKTTTKNKAKPSNCPRCGAPIFCAFCSRQVIRQMRLEEHLRESPSARQAELTATLEDFEGELYRLEDGQHRSFANSVWEVIRIIAAIRSTITEGTPLTQRALARPTTRPRACERATRDMLPDIQKIVAQSWYTGALKSVRASTKQERTMPLKEAEALIAEEFPDQLRVPLMLAIEKHLRRWIRLPRYNDPALEFCAGAVSTFISKAARSDESNPALAWANHAANADELGLALAVRLIQAVALRAGVPNASDFCRARRKKR